MSIGTASVRELRVTAVRVPKPYRSSTTSVENFEVVTSYSHAWPRLKNCAQADLCCSSTYPISMVLYKDFLNKLANWTLKSILEADAKNLKSTQKFMWHADNKVVRSATNLTAWDKNVTKYLFIITKELNYIPTVTTCIVNVQNIQYIQEQFYTILQLKNSNKTIFVFSTYVELFRMVVIFFALID